MTEQGEHGEQEALKEDQANKTNGGKETNGSMEAPLGLLSLAMWKLYLSRFLTAWGDRLWAFGLSILVFRIRDQDLTLIAAYGLTNCLVQILLGSAVGSWIDRTTRMRAAKIFLMVQNSSVALTCAILASHFFWTDQLTELIGEWEPILAAVLAIVIALVSTVASMGSKIVVERDWIVVIAGGDLDRLARMNSTFRVIDLVCLTATPALAGLFLDYTSYAVTALAIGAWNIVSVVLELLLLISIYHQFPGLSDHKPVAQTDSKGLLSSMWNTVGGWKLYFRHRTFLAGLGLALLYMTVLGFDGITWGFVLLQCVSAKVLGALVAVSALVGLLGALVFPLLRSCMGVERTGVAGMCMLVCSLSLCVASLWLEGSPFDPGHVTTSSTLLLDTDQPEHCEATSMVSVSVLLAGIILARLGLWIADLSISQIQQEQVEEESRGLVGGVQAGLQSAFNMAKFLLVLFMPNPHLFGILILLSFSCVSLGALSLTLYAALQGKLCCKGQTYQAAPTTEPNPSELPQSA